jgi:hypothetical protein
VEVTVGRHTAANDATVHPLVAEGLARRTGGSTALHGRDEAGRPGSTGWPEPPGPEPKPGDGGGLGWPDDALPDQDAEPHDADPQDRALGGRADRGVTSAIPEPRRGWRRLFGAGSAA